MDEDNKHMVPAKVLGCNWVECTDRIRNKVYYANLETKETTWEFPNDLVDDKTIVNHAKHWIEAMDTQQRKKYYYNRISKEAMWNTPECLIVQPSHVSAAGVNSTAAPTKKAKKAAMMTSLYNIKSEVDREEAERQLEAAEKKNDKDRRQQKIVSIDNDEQKYLETLLEAGAISTEELFEMSSSERSLYNYGRLNFATARSGIFNRKVKVEKLLEWSSKGLKDPLHNMQGEMMTEAIQFSKNIRGFMGDRSSTKNNLEHADKIIKVLLLSSQELRDEFFCQLCKQLNKNPSKQSCVRGWQLFLICLTSASPNNELMVSLIDFCKPFIKGDDKEIASLAEDTLHKCYIATKLHGARCERPNAVEMASITSANPIHLRIWFLDGVYISVQCDSWMLVSELELIIAQELGILAPKYFGLYEALSSGEERLLHYDDRVLDLVAQWKRFQVEGKNAYDHIKFVYKVRYFVSIQDETDVSSIEMMYIQAVHDVLNMIDLCKSEDAFDLAALQVFDKLGDFDPVHSVKLLNRDIENYVPSRVFDTVGRQDVIETVCQRYAELSGYTTQDARMEYIRITRELPSYGSSYFLVTTNGLGSNSKGFQEVVVAINPKGLFVIDNYTKEYIRNYYFENILTWGHSPSQFIIATGTTQNRITVSFKCKSGKEMSDMMSVYFSDLKKN